MFPPRSKSMDGKRRRLALETSDESLGWHIRSPEGSSCGRWCSPGYSPSTPVHIQNLTGALEDEDDRCLCPPAVIDVEDDRCLCPPAVLDVEDDRCSCPDCAESCFFTPTTPNIEQHGIKRHLPTSEAYFYARSSYPSDVWCCYSHGDNSYWCPPVYHPSTPEYISNPDPAGGVGEEDDCCWYHLCEESVDSCCATTPSRSLYSSVGWCSPSAEGRNYASPTSYHPTTPVYIFNPAGGASAENDRCWCRLCEGSVDSSFRWCSPSGEGSVCGSPLPYHPTTPEYLSDPADSCECSSSVEGRIALFRKTDV